MSANSIAHPGAARSRRRSVPADGQRRAEHADGVYYENGGIFHTEGYPAFRPWLAELGLVDRVTTVPTGSMPQ